MWNKLPNELVSCEKVKQLYISNDLDEYDPKPSFDVEVRDSNYVTDFHIKLTEMIDLSGSECFAEFYR